MPWLSYFNPIFMKQLCLALSILLLASCNPSIDEATLETELMEIDKSFSHLSLERGMNNAFMTYLDPEGILLRPNRFPIVGTREVEEVLLETDDSEFELSWEPSGAKVAKSGEFGFTYGIYTFSTGSQEFKGTYVTVWRKDEQGNWKWVLDTGNQGVGEETRKG